MIAFPHANAFSVSLSAATIERLAEGAKLTVQEYQPDRLRTLFASVGLPPQAYPEALRDLAERFPNARYFERAGRRMIQCLELSLTEKAPPPKTNPIGYAEWKGLYHRWGRSLLVRVAERRLEDMEEELRDIRIAAKEKGHVAAFDFAVKEQGPRSMTAEARAFFDALLERDETQLAYMFRGQSKHLRTARIFYRWMTLGRGLL